ncbi:hypothetical protein IGI04_029986 [Brassica rapa subsp. trilocularis]|uniref:Anaphase-promoting complex subunit 4 WD40 domain-containing protein n=1 Tax=Brassica rapa subsp. trilocularis TaxID=1813537 RepID=A0ABQ7LR06_BRACM|nr:hypothetical protein IGI04_029986 [Brassica rapa subsp. trilocularis]
MGNTESLHLKYSLGRRSYTNSSKNSISGAPVSQADVRHSTFDSLCLGRTSHGIELWESGVGEFVSDGNGEGDGG